MTAQLQHRETAFSHQLANTSRLCREILTATGLRHCAPRRHPAPRPVAPNVHDQNGQTLANSKTRGTVTVFTDRG